MPIEVSNGVGNVSEYTEVGVGDRSQGGEKMAVFCGRKKEG